MKKIIANISLVAMLLGISTSIYAQLPYNTTLTQDQFNDGNTVIKKEGSVSWGDGVKLGKYAPFNWDDKYIVIALDQSSIPYQLTFSYKCNNGIATNPDWYVEESADNSNWSRIWSTVTPTSSPVSVSTDTYTVDPIDLSKSTKYLKLCYSGNYDGTISEIQVSDQAYVNDPIVDDAKITSLNFGIAAISSGKAEKNFDIEWCNVNELSVTSDNKEFFTVTPASFGSKVKYGTQTITVTYDRDKEVGSHNATITITNGSDTKIVTVSGTTTKRSQAIHWNAELTATNYTLNAGDNLTGEAIATADNEEAEITYTSSDTAVIAVSPDGKTLYAINNGTALITITATGNEIYDEAVDTKEFTVTSKSKQTITWEQNLLGLKTTQADETIVLEATATSGGVITYSIEGGSTGCITLSGENNAILTITGIAGEAYIIATQEGGVIGEEEWISATYRKHVKVRDPNAACDEYALADESFTFAQSHKSTFAVQEYNLVGKPTELTFTAKAGGKQYPWSEREPIYIDQYANFGSGLEWKQVTAVILDENRKNYGPYNMEESATKIRFRTGDYSKQEVSNISIPRKKELVVSETEITEEAERNVRWTKMISVSRSNIDVVDIMVESNDAACPFEVSRTSIGTDCADRSTETFEVSLTPRAKGTTYTGLITITDGKASPATHTINLSVTAVAFNQSITGFELPDSVYANAQVPAFEAVATSGEEVVYLSSDSAIAYVEKNQLVIVTAGTVDITAYQEGNDRYNAASVTKTITISLVPVEILTVPTASAIIIGQSLAEAELTDGVASCEGSFAWQDSTIIPELGEHTYPVIFTPADTAIYAPAVTEVTVQVVNARQAQTITWEQEISEIYVSYSIGLTATASSGLEITYLSSDSTIAYVDSLNQLVTVAVGEVVITATQEGNSAYYAADSVAKTVIVVPIPTTYGEYAASFCQGDSVEFAGVWYHSATEQEVLMEEKNTYGGDSIVRLSITVDPVYAITDSLSFMTGQSVEWQSIVLDSFPIGDTTLVAAYSSIHGCDSVYTLYLTVRPRIVTYGSDTVLLCAGDTYEYEGHTYKHATVDSVRLSRPNSYGGDSIVILVVQVLPSMRITSSQTIYEGDTVTWQDIDLSVIPAGDTTLTVIYSSVYGCDSTFVLQLTVVEKETGIDPIDVNAGKVEKFFRNGEMYIRKNGLIYNLQGIKIKEE